MFVRYNVNFRDLFFSYVCKSECEYVPMYVGAPGGESCQIPEAVDIDAGAGNSA